MYSKIRVAFLFVIMTFAFSLQSKAQTEDSLLNQLARKWNNAKDYTMKVAELMPYQFYDFSPVPDEMSFKKQLVHIAQNIHRLSSSYLLSGTKTPINDTAANDKAAVLAIINNAYEMAMAVHQNLTAKQLDEVVPFFAGPMTRRQILLLLHDHQSHHLGQLIVYLRLKGIKPPPYVGW